MPIPATAVTILSVLFDWLEVIIILVIIYMIVHLFTDGKGVAGLRDMFGGGGGDKGSGGRGGSKNGNSDGGKGNGAEDTSKDYPNWMDGFANLSVWVTDIDDNPIHKAKVTIKHEKIPGMSKKRKGYSGRSGTFGPKRIPAGPVMVKATHRNWFQYAITLGAAALGATAIGGGNPLVGGLLALGGAGGLKFLSSDRYAMKEWFPLEKDKDVTFHIRLKRLKGEKEYGFRPIITDVILHDKNAKGEDKSRLKGEIK